jgi:hypothetical protein
MLAETLNKLSERPLRVAVKLFSHFKEDFSRFHFPHAVANVNFFHFLYNICIFILNLKPCLSGKHAPSRISSRSA